MNLLFAPIIVVVFIILFVLITKKAVYIKNINIVLIMYILVLCVFTIIYFVVPKPDNQIEAVQLEEVHDFEQFDEISQMVYSSLENGKLDQVKNKIIDKQVYEFDGKELIIKQSPSMEEWFNIFIEIKDHNDGIIDVTQLQTGTYVGNMDVTEYISPAKLEFNEGQLIFHEPEPEYLRLTSFKKEFPITQFSGEKDEILELGYSSYFGNNVIYIQIPKDTVVKNDTTFEVQYVKK